MSELSLEEEVQALRERNEELQSSLIQAANFGKSLLSSKVALEAQYRELQESVEQREGEGSQKTMEELHAKIRVLQEQLREAEIQNDRLLQDFQTKSKKLARLSISANRNDRLSSPSMSAVDPAQSEEIESLTQKLEKQHQQKEDWEKKLQDQEAEYEEKLKALEGKLTKEEEKSARLDKVIRKLSEEMEIQEEKLGEKSQENEILTSELGKWQQMVRKITQDKEVAEEKFQEIQSQSENQQVQAKETVSLQDEQARLAQLEQARRALMQIRNRTMEAEAMRQQISVVVGENKKIQAQLDTVSKEKEALQRKCVEYEIEMEIWRERGVELNKY